MPGDRLRARALPPLRSPQRLGGRGPQLSRTIASERRRYGLPVVDHVVVVATGGYSSAAPAPGPEIGRWAAIERELGFRPQTARGLGIVSPSEAGSALATSVPFRDEVADARRRAVLRTQLACPGDESVDDRSSLL